MCFQQDLLERAKRLEEEWLPSAVAQISSAMEIRGQVATEQIQQRQQQQQSLNTNTPPKPEIPVVLAYSANPALSSSTIVACVNAGAAGVLKPPYDLDTARLVRRMVRAAREGRISSVVGYASYDSTLGDGSGLSGTAGLGKVVLPPTALSMGGEHEGEKVLSGAYRPHRRGTSIAWDTRTLSPVIETSRSRDLLVPNSTARKGSIPQALALPTFNPLKSVNTPTSAKTPGYAQDILEDQNHLLASLYVYNPSYQQRRRSVDTAGLGIALRRAQRAFEAIPSVPKAIMQPGFTFPAQRVITDGHGRRFSHQHIDGENCKETQLAELLSAMFYQTQVATDIQMDEYARCASNRSWAWHES